MWKIFTPPSKTGTSLHFQITGMHCVNCSLTIDAELEELPGVLAAQTSYAKAETRVTFDEQVTSVDQLRAKIRELGYEAAPK